MGDSDRDCRSPDSSSAASPPPPPPMGSPPAPSPKFGVPPPPTPKFGVPLPRDQLLPGLPGGPRDPRPRLRPRQQPPDQLDGAALGAAARSGSEDVKPPLGIRGPPAAPPTAPGSGSAPSAGTDPRVGPGNGIFPPKPPESPPPQ
ncbi:formin-like protein 20 [Corvus hawaiiensis]|uniref:formin-like protein 20 n=1 Tax=Corvus hawaiiensis TaxID=134902 RepID=UPI00201856C0|nr:formin-like protein 20 [Corvus hawaiiensis]